MKALFFTTALFSVASCVSAQQPLAQSKADVLFNEGLVLMSHQEPGAAQKKFSAFLEAAEVNDPRQKDAAYYGALCAINLYHNDGEKRISEFVAENPTHPRAALANYDLASLFYQQKNYTKAIANFKRVDFLGLSPEQQNAGRFRWGYSLFSQRKLAEASDQFSFVKGQGGQFGPAASYYAGYIELSQGDYPNALIDLKRAELNEAYSTVVPYLIAQALYKQKQYSELLSYERTIAQREDVSQVEDIALLVAEVHFQKSEFEEALTGFETFIDKRPGADRGITYKAGYAAMRAGNDEKAVAYFKKSGTANDSIGAFSSYYLGSIYLKAAQKPMALTAFDVARKFKGDKLLEEESAFEYAKLAYDLGKSDEAITELEKFQVTYPSSARLSEVKEILSHAYVDANNYNKAIEYIESLPRRGPAVDRAYQKASYLKGTELFNMERYGEAAQFFEKSLRYPLDPAITTDCHYWCAEAYSIGAKYDLAIDHYAALISPTAVASKDVIALARYGLGYAYFNLKQYDRALHNFREFTTGASPSNAYWPDALLRLADCYYVAKDYNGALSTYRRVLQAASPDKDYAHLQAGIILGIQRKYAEAAQALGEVVRIHPPSGYKEEALFQLAQLDFEQGKYAAAVTGYGRVIDGSKTSKFIPYAHMRRAAAYFNLKDYNKTASDYVLVVQHYPLHPVAKDVLIPLQEALTLAGRTSEFDQYLNAFKTANPDARGIESVEFETAKNLYFNQDYGKVIARFTTYLIAYPESPRITEAKFYQAESYYRLKDYNQSLTLHESILGDEAFSMITKVVARVAELRFRAARYEDALASFTRLAAMATNKKDQYNAWSGLMESHYLLGRYDSADKYARIILEKGNINAGATNKAALFLGKDAMARGDYETAKDEFLSTLNTAHDEYGAEAKYLMGEIFYLTKEHKQCYETLVSLNTDFAAYTDWVGKSYLLLSDNFVAMGDPFSARATLTSLVENFPLQDVKDQAIVRLKQLDAVDKANEVKQDSIDNK